MKSKLREFWIQIKQHEHEWLHGSLNTNVYTQEHTVITQDKDKDLKWHKDMCILVREVDPVFDALVLEMVEACRAFKKGFDKLEAKLAIAVDKLEYISDAHEHCPCHVYAKDALEIIEKL